MSTFLHGVGTVQFLDKSAELVDLKGLDTSSLAKTGIVNYEHKSDIPAQLVGKILKAKKIFNKDDCSNEHELHFWNKVKTPYLYIMAELLDDYCDSAKHVAGILRYDRDKKDQNEYAIAWFSVEGSEIPGTRANKQTVSRGIARKVTLTSAPCNQGCAVEILENQAPQIKDDFEEIFKSEANAIEMLKSNQGLKIYEEFLIKKEQDININPKGTKIGTTSTGKDVHFHAKVAEYGFNPSEHKEAGEMHRKAAINAEDLKSIDHHIERMKLHNSAALTGTRKENKRSLEFANKKQAASIEGKKQMRKSENKLCDLHKALTRDKHGPASTTGHEKGVHTGVEFRETDKKMAGMSDTGSHVSDSQNSHISEDIRTAASNYAKQNHKKVLNDLKTMPKPKLDKAEGPSWSSGKVSGDTVHFNHPEHGTVSIQKQPSGQFHVKHQGKLAGLGGVKGSFSTSKEAGAHAKKYMSSVSSKQHSPAQMHNRPSPQMPNMGKNEENKNLQKALTAGSNNAAPSTLVNGSAYQTENLSRSQSSTGSEDNKFQGTKKKDWNKRASEEYDRWPHKEKFEKFMSARMPHLAMGEIRAIGKVVSLKKSVDFEKSLDSLVSKKKN